MLARYYQNDLKHGIYEAWASGHRHVLAVAPTGAGKTFIKAMIMQEAQYPACCIAHRQELIDQISMSLAHAGIYHKIIAPPHVIKLCVTSHVRELGRSFHDQYSPIAVTGIDTLLKRAGDLVQWLHHVMYCGIDEAHHVLRVNKWGKGVALFPNALVFGMTATPRRCDRKSLSAERGGIFDKMVTGPTTRQLMDEGHLSEYKVIGPKPSMDIGAIKVSKATGELNPDSMRKEAHSERSTVVGDIVDHYLKWAPGKMGITFVVDIEQAKETASAFNAKGVRAEAVSGKTPGHVRNDIIARFRRGEIRNLVNVDLFGEGMDVPGVEVVSKGRPTMSLGLDMQQSGRCLRPADGKEYGIIIDHVENVKRHGLPDTPHLWSLEDDTEKRRKNNVDDAIPVTTCTNLSCMRAYERVLACCPYCGHKPVPDERGKPEHVDGDLIEYGPELLASLGKEIKRIDAPVLMPGGLLEAAQRSVNRVHMERQTAQGELRDCIAMWAGIEKHVHEHTDSHSYRKFYFTFGVDIMSAMTLKTSDANLLANKVRDTLS